VKYSEVLPLEMSGYFKNHSLLTIKATTISLVLEHFSSHHQNFDILRPFISPSKKQSAKLQNHTGVEIYTYRGSPRTKESEC